MDEVEIIFEYFKKNSDLGVMLDVGAHHGKSSLPFLEAGWDIYAFEPDPDNYKILVDTLSTYETFYVDNRAVADKTCESLPFYTSPISSGISSLCSFHETHTVCCETKTVTLSDFCNEKNIQKIDFLKIDTEGFDLLVLNGIDWDKIRPKVIICEFEDVKTTCLSYTFIDLGNYLESKGYTLFISEWHPVVRYGSQHSWRCFHKWPCELHDKRGWGNIIAFSDEVDVLTFVNSVASYAEKMEKKSRQTSQKETQLPKRALKNGLQVVNKLSETFIQNRWAQLLESEKIYTVLLTGDEAWVVKFLEIIRGLPGPDIVGIIDDTDALKVPDIDGIPIVNLNKVSDCIIDAVILPSCIEHNNTAKCYLDGLLTDKPIIDLFEGFPLIYYLRLMRDLKLAVGNLNSAKKTGEQILNCSPDEKDFEIFYRIGLELHNDKNRDLAQVVYKKVANDERAGYELNAWALFKNGELLLEEGEEASAQIFFAEALLRNPNHTKAAIFNTPDGQQLRVCLTTDNKCVEDGCITVSMEPTNEELWLYYFNYRKPDFMSLHLGEGFQINKLRKLFYLICKFIAPGGIVNIGIISSEVYSRNFEKMIEISKFFNLNMSYCDSKKMIVIKKTEKNKVTI